MAHTQAQIFESLNYGNPNMVGKICPIVGYLKTCSKSALRAIYLVGIGTPIGIIDTSDPNDYSDRISAQQFVDHWRTTMLPMDIAKDALLVLAQQAFNSDDS